MLQEIIYTSAPQGLKPGSRGFCTVISSPGMPVNLAQQLEALSGYRHLFPPQDPQAALNPTVYAHLRLNVAGRPLHVLSRIADAGLDYSQRTNKFAHHLVLDAPDCPPGGPAWALATPGLMATGWDGQPRVAPVLRKLPRDERPAGPCTAWEAQLGDAGWAGVLAETAAVGRPAVLLFEPGMEVLPLFVEALSLLPPAQRWTVTFSTFFTRLPPGVNCQWRAVLAGSAEARALAAGPHLVIDLRKPRTAPNGLLVETARTGEAPERGLELSGAEEFEVSKVAAPPGTLDGWEDAQEVRLAPPPMPGRRLWSFTKIESRKQGRPHTSFWFPIALGLVLLATVVGGLWWSIERRRSPTTTVAAKVGNAAVSQAEHNSGAASGKSSDGDSSPPGQSGGAASDVSPDHHEGQPGGASSGPPGGATPEGKPTPGPGLGNGEPKSDTDAVDPGEEKEKGASEHVPDQGAEQPDEASDEQQRNSETAPPSGPPWASLLGSPLPPLRSTDNPIILRRRPGDDRTVKEIALLSDSIQAVRKGPDSPKWAVQVSYRRTVSATPIQIATISLKDNAIQWQWTAMAQGTDVERLRTSVMEVWFHDNSKEPFSVSSHRLAPPLQVAQSPERRPAEISLALTLEEKAVRATRLLMRAKSPGDALFFDVGVVNSAGEWTVEARPSEDAERAGIRLLAQLNKLESSSKLTLKYRDVLVHPNLQQFLRRENGEPVKALNEKDFDGLVDEATKRLAESEKKLDDKKSLVAKAPSDSDLAEQVQESEREVAQWKAALSTTVDQRAAYRALKGRAIDLGLYSEIHGYRVRVAETQGFGAFPP